MAEVKIRVELNSNAGSEAINTVGSSQELANVSIKTTNDVFNAKPSKETKGANFLSFAQGYLVFNEQGVLCNPNDPDVGVMASAKNPEYFIWSPTDSDGLLSDDPIVITLDAGTDTNGNPLYIDEVIFAGNKQASQYPIEATFDDGNSFIYSDDYLWIIKFPERKQTQTITFTKWNRPNYNAMLTYIGIQLQYFDITNTYLNDVSTLTQSTSNPSEPFYGVLANSGSINLVDVDGRISDLIEDGIMPISNVPVQVYLNNNLIQTHITTDSSYNASSNEVSISLSNILQNMSKRKYRGFDYPEEPRNLYDVLYDVFCSYYGPTFYNTKYTDFLRNFYKFLTGKDAGTLTDDAIYSELNKFGMTGTDIPTIYEWAFNTSPTGLTEEEMIVAILDMNSLNSIDSYTFPTGWFFDDMLSESVVYGSVNSQVTISEYLKLINIKYPVIEANQIYEDVINQICTVSQLQMYLNDDGNIQFTSARPVTGNSDFTFIPKSNIMSDFDTDLVIKNKSDGVEISEYNVEIQTQTDTPVFTSHIENIDNTYISYSEETNTTFISDLSKTNNPAVSIIYSYDLFGNINGGGGTFLYMKGEYYSGSMEIKKKQKNGIDNIYELKDIYCSTSFKKYRAGISSDIATPSLSDVVFNEAYQVEEEHVGEIPNQEIYNVNVYIDDKQLGGTITLNNSNSINAVDNGDYYTVEYTVLIGIELYEMWGWGFTSAPTDIKWRGTAYKYEPTYFDITINGNKQTIVFNETNVNTANIDNSKTILSISTNKLLQSQTTLEGTKISDIIKQNILSDYADGIKTAKVTLSGTDIKDRDGNIIKDFKNGELINIGDVTAFGNQRYRDGSLIKWKTTGRNFKFDGEPLTEIEIMETKYAEEKLGFELSGNSYSVYLKDKYKEDELYISIPSTYDDGINGVHSVTTIKQNGFSHSNIKSISFPSTINTIQSSAFVGCSNLEKVYAPSLGRWLNINFGNQYSNPISWKDGCELYLNNTLMSGEIIIPTNVYYINPYAFREYDYITSLTWNPDENYVDEVMLVAIGQSFRGCINLESVNLGLNISDISQEAFYGCSSLSSVILSESITRIYPQAFTFTNLSSVTFGNTTNWKIGETGETINVSNPSTNAANLKTDGIWNNVTIRNDR